MPGRKLTSILEQRQPVLVQSDDTIAHAAREMSRLAQNAALVLRKSRTVGIITETDI
ncbi:MAG: CBS domain-containing protein, partial [Gammaproteobacteria bacterium]|nr:CBS domain-containing protein [Gammaproteobacteria bacterium]